MIDIEPEVFNKIAISLRNKFKGIYVMGEIIDTVNERFPAVSIIEKSNTVDQTAIDSGSIENYADLMYEVNVYSNLETGKKQQAKNIAKHIDSIFADMGFIRTICYPIDNLSAPTIYRIFSRYEGKADENKNIFRK